MENWRDIPGYESIYQASDQGRIRTCEGKVTANKAFQRRVWKQRVLRQKVQKRNASTRYADARVDLWKDGRKKTFLVSRLVAMTWCEGYADYLTVDHKDGNTLNNRADNLQWVTRGDNIRKGYAQGFYPQIHVMLIDDAGEKKTFRSLRSAGRFLGCSSPKMSRLIRHDDPRFGQYKIVIF